jgi:hypothetical protein
MPWQVMPRRTMMIGRLIGILFGWHFQNESESVIWFFFIPKRYEIERTESA